MTQRTTFSQFLRSEDGGGTAWGLFLMATVMMTGGYAIDVQNVTKERTHLQTVADTAAHAALVKRERASESEAIETALLFAKTNMPPGVFGSVLDGADVEFGTWDPDAATFTPQSGDRDAVRVRLARSEARGNAIGTYLFQMVGIDEWNIEVSSVFSTYSPTCFREGFVGIGPVDIQSNNNFGNGFCVHSNEYVSMNSNNYFEPGTVVSMPDVDNLDIPNSGFETNIGLEAALRSGSYNIRIINRIDDIVSTIGDPSSDYFQDFITNSSSVLLAKKTINAVDLPEGRIINWSCSGNKGTIEKDTVVKNVVIKTACEVTFGFGVIVENSVIVNTNTSARSFNASSGFQLGRNDSCATGGDAQLVTLGGMNFAANLQVYGSQLLAMGDIEFAAQADGIQGAAMVSAGTISGTSNMSMAFCGTGMEDNFEAAYFRMVD